MADTAQDTAPSPANDRLARFRQAQQGLADTHAAITTPNLDRSTGADLIPTAAVGAAPTQADELSTLRKYYPDAKPFGDGNYVYTNPDTGRPTLYKATGATMHPLTWLARNAQEVPALIGGGLGALGGAIFGSAAGPVGTIGGAMAGAGAGTVGGIEGWRGLMQTLVGTDDTRTTGQVVGDVGTNMLLGGAGEGAGRAIGAGVRAAMPLVGRAEPGITAAAESLFPGQGTQAIAGMPALATGSKALNATLEHFGAIPTATNTLEAGKQGVRDALTEAQQRIVGNIGGSGSLGTTADTQTAMDALQGTAKDAVKSYETNIGALQRRIGTLGANVPVVPYNLQNTVNALKAGVRDAPNTAADIKPALDFANNLLERSRFNALANGEPGLSLPGALKERTTLGGRIDFPLEGERADSTQQALMAVRNALKDDIYDSAKRVGNANPQLAPTLQLHDQYVTAMRGGKAPLTPGAAPGGYMTVQDLGKLVEKNPADAFNAVTQNAFKSGPNGGNGVELMRVRNSIEQQNPQAWRDFAAHYFERMFQPNPGVARTPGQVAGTEPLSGIANFSTQWNALSPGAKRALFDGYLPPGQRQQLDSLATLANQYVRAGYDVNRSNSGVLMTGIKMLTNPFTLPIMGTMMGHPIAGLAGGAASLGTLAAAPMGMRLLQSPAFTRWLTSSAREIALRPNHLPTALARLGAMQFNNPAERQAVSKYIEAIGATSGPSGESQ